MYGGHLRQARDKTYAAQHRLLAVSLRCCHYFVSCRLALSAALRPCNHRRMVSEPRLMLAVPWLALPALTGTVCFAHQGRLESS